MTYVDQGQGSQAAETFLQSLDNYQGPSYAQMAAGNWGNTPTPQADAINIPQNVSMPTQEAYQTITQYATEITNAGGTVPPDVQSELASIQAAYKADPGGTYYFANAQGVYTAIADQFGASSAQATGFVNTVAQNSGATSAYQVLQSTLQQYGLGDLSNWAWDKAVNGESSQQILTDLRNTPQYAARFPGMKILQQNGYPAISESTYINYEQNAMQLFQQAGLPKAFYATPQAIGNLIGNNVSISELNQRVNNAYAAVANAPNSVRNAFAQYFGINGDSMLAAHVLDPNEALPILMNQVTASQIGGSGSQLGINMSGNRAYQLAQLGVSQSAAQNTLQGLSQQAGYFQQNPGQTNVPDINTEGVDAAFGLSATAQQDVARAQAQGRAAFAGGGTTVGGNNGQSGAGVETPF